jgi:glycosyltransferase involved in cell wall biosynthesis
VLRVPESAPARRAAPTQPLPAKILFVIGTLDVGGAETQLVELASRLDRRYFEPVVCSLFSGGDLAGILAARGIRVHALGLNELPSERLGTLRRFPKAWRALRHMSRIIRRERPVILHGVLLWAYVLGAFLGRPAGVPVIVASRRSLGLFKERKPHYLFLERLANRMTDLFIANSEAVRLDTLRRENVRAQNIIVIRNGLDLARFDVPADPALAEALGVTTSPRAIVVSNFIHYKGHRFFFQAWKTVLAGFPSAVAMLVGDGVLRPELEHLADELGIRPSLRFLGVRHDVPALLALADVYVHPSLQEGYSNALLEAMGAGKAVVATRVGGNGEAIADGTTGLLVPPASPAALEAAMLRLFGNPDEARRMGDAARQHVRREHDIDAMVRKYEEVYQGLLADAARAQRGRAGWPLRFGQRRT